MITILSSCSKEKVDLLIKAERIYTVDESFSIVEAMVIKDGKIYDTGTYNDLSEKYEANEDLNLSGKFIYPGLIDPHCHFYGYCMGLQYADLTGTKSFDEILKILSERYKNEGIAWIKGHGWDQNDWEIKEFPDNTKLNELFPSTPVILTRIDGHAVIANAKALELAGIDENTKIEGGKILQKNGKLTGVLIDNAADRLKELTPDNSIEQKIKYLIEGQQNCFSVGLTSLSDAGLESNIIELYDSLHKSRDLKMRIYAMVAMNEENIEKYVKKGIYKTNYLNVRSIKLYSDGALGSRGACLLESYSDDPNNKGLIVTSPEELRNYCKIAYDNNYQVATHCIGDSANRLILNIYSEFLKTRNNLRWRIEHSQVINEKDFELFGKYSIIPCIQTTHATSDMYWAEKRLGKERVKNAYPYQELLQQNGWIPNGSDFPIENINPIYGFYSAVVRKDFENYPKNGFQTENALTREQALRAMTIWAAKSSFEENEKGSIEKGKFADFVVTDKDLMDEKEQNLYKIKISKTFINGEKVYEN